MIYGAAIGTVTLGSIGMVLGVAGGMIYDYANGNEFGTSTWTWTKAGFGIGTLAGVAFGLTIGGFAVHSVTGLSNVAFWTGLGPNGAQIAANAAAQQGLITIGQTFGGQAVQLLTNIFGRGATEYLWISLSQTMAASVNMSSVILFVYNLANEISRTSIWYKYERKILELRGIKIIPFSIWR